MQVSLDHKAGIYSDRQTVDWITSNAVDFVMFTINGLTPTLSEYIAYDTLNPPNPFIAVTQDNRGNVVYDGGFPKYYNIYWNGATSFAGLTGAGKFFYNTLNFIANKEKVKNGNKKVLILGDAVPGESYPIRSGESMGFVTTFSRVCALAGFTPTFRDRNQYTPAGMLNPDKAELDQYCSVIIMSSDYYNAFGRLTPAAVKALLEFREAGNGVFMITDHGPVISKINNSGKLDVEFAATGKYIGFFSTANQLAAEFGAYFSGDYDRFPVNVGFIRENYGDHVLYNNMTNAQSIHAGYSESRVFIADYRRWKPDELPPLELEDGCYNIQILAKMKDGSVEIQRVLICIDNSGNGRYKSRKLYVRETSGSPWIANFSKGGWQIHKASQETDGIAKGIIMTPQNTRLWDAKNKEWVYVK